MMRTLIAIALFLSACSTDPPSETPFDRCVRTCGQRGIASYKFHNGSFDTGYECACNPMVKP